ncbi:MAG: gliding motility protein GldM, partial [Crocinitomicaceae bacterium]
MAGGKETPRQKMIGMMYLVLTALLALNVSKQILDAFVAIEENIQRSTLTQLDRGNAAKDEMRTAMADALSQKTPEMQQKAEKIKRYLSIVDLIDKEAAKV